MKKLFLLLGLLMFNCGILFAEEIVITTYYPSPYGSYDKLGVGGSVPTSSGDLWVSGTVRAGAFQTGATAGISQSLSVRDSGGGVDCSITVTNGIITASTC